MISLVLGGFLALFATPTHAQNPTLTPATFADFTGGLNDRDDPANLKANESPDLLNVIIDEGAIKPRGGYITCGKLPSGSVPTEMYNYSKSDGTQYLIVADNTNVYQTADCSNWTRIVTGQSATNKPTFRTVRDDLWFVNGATWAYKWDGSTTTILDGGANTPSPAPPRGRYIEFWRERVWIASTSGDPSLLAFSAIVDSAGNDITPSTGTGAWPATNTLYIDRDGGSRIYGIKAYRDNIYVFKGNGIWRVDFRNDFDIQVIKTLSSVGSRFGSSIVEKDNVLHFVGPDGIYAFDGDNSVRLSDKISNKFRTISQPLTAEGTKIWTNQSDFEDGTFINSTATESPGSVVIVGTTGLVNNGGFETGSFSPWTCVRVGPNGGCGIGTGEAFTGVFGASVTASAASLIISLYVFDTAGTTVAERSHPLETAAYTLNTSSGQGRLGRLHFATIDQVGNEGHLYSPVITIGSIVRYNAGISAIGFGRLDDVEITVYEATATWTSDTYEAVGLSSWSFFDAESRTRGGSISYQVRVGSSALNVSTATWSGILAGSLIPGATWENFIQVRANLNAPSDLQNTPSLDSVSVGFLKGGSQTQTIYGASWKNRYWFTSNSGDFASTKSQSRTWDTAADWTTGTLIDIDTSTAVGFIVGGGTKLIHDNFTDGNYTASPKWDAYPAASWGITSGKLRVEGTDINSGNNITSSNTMATGEWIFQHSFKNGIGNQLPGFGSSNNVGMVFQFVDNSTSATSAPNVVTGGAYFIQIKNTEVGTSHVITLSSSATNAIAASRGVALASHTLTYAGNDTVHNYRITRDYRGLMAVYLNGTKILEATDTAISSSTRLVIGGNGTGAVYQDFDNIFFKNPSSATWVSPVVRIDNNTRYGTFLGDKTELNGTVRFMMRAATSESALYQTAFTTVTSGQDISFSADSNYFQTAASIFSETSRQFVSSMSVSYTNRVQQSDGSNNMVLVNSRYDSSSWVPHDMMIAPMVIFNDRFYVGSSTGSSIYRMDYGTNDSGQVLPWYWTSRDEFWGSPAYRKDLLQLSVNYRLGTAAGAFVGFSRNSGASWTDKTVNMSGTGRGSKTLYVNGGNNYDFRFRFGSNSLDESASVLSVTGWAKTYRVPE